MIDKVLIIDDDKMICNLMKTSLGRHGLEIVCVGSGEEGIEILERRRDFDVCFCDMQMDRINGLDVLEFAKGVVPDMLFAMMTARDDAEMMESSLQAGAFDILVKPFTTVQADAVIVKAVKWMQLSRENVYLRHAMRFSSSTPDDNGERIFGNSYQITRVVQLCNRAASSKKTVLITGERGTGKKLIADEICRLCDPDGLKAKVRLDCESIPPDQLESLLFGMDSTSPSGVSENHIGRLEIADGGFLLLENVSVLTLAAQERLANFLQTGEFRRIGGNSPIKASVRILATSRKPLRREVDLDHFLEELYYLLKSLPIDIPPLHERNNDVMVVAKKLLRRACLCSGKDIALSAQALDRMKVYQWPGNVGELEQLINRLILVAEGPVITAEHLPNDILKVKPVTLAVSEADVNRMFNIREIERLTIIRALKETKGNRSKAADLLGFTSRTLRNKLVEYDDAGIWNDDFDPKKKRKPRR